MTTLNYICQLASHCLKLVRSSSVLVGSIGPELNICSYTGQSSTNRQTGDLMLSGKSFIKIRNRIGPKTDPWGTPDNTGTGSEA